MLLQTYDEDIQQISLIYFIFNNIKCHQISALAIVFFGNFCRHGVKTRKNWPIFFSSFNSCPPLPSIVTDGMKQFLSLNIVWTIIWNSVDCDEMFQLSKKIVNGMTSFLKVCSIRQFYCIFQLLTVKELFNLLTLNLKGLSQVF